MSHRPAIAELYGRRACTELTDPSSQVCRSINAARTNGVRRRSTRRPSGAGTATHRGLIRRGHADMKRARGYLAVLIAGPAMALVTATSSGATVAPATTTAALPAVNMEATVMASQIDPRRADDTLTPGAKGSVLLVEQALQAKHLLDAKWVDGYFGTTTVAAYAAYQRRSATPVSTPTGCPARRRSTKLGRAGSPSPTPSARARRSAATESSSTPVRRRCSPSRASAQAQADAEPGLVQPRRRPDVGRHPRRRRRRRHLGRRDDRRHPHQRRHGSAAGRLRRLGSQPQPGRLAVAHPRGRDQ